jgi:two-component system sensor histidine kinase KdpD
LLTRAATAVGLVALITAVYVRVVSANPTTIALSYLIAILLIATRWGIAEATVASLGAVLCFNFFFLPPIGTLTIADPQNWVALLAFLITAVVTSQLSGRARRRNLEAADRQRDLERLYALSRSLLLSETGLSLPAGMAQRIAETFELPAVALFDQQTDTIAQGGVTELRHVEARLREVARSAVTFHEPGGLVVVPIRLGGAPIGSLALTGTLHETVIQSIANLAAIGLERARGHEAAARADAAHRSSELRAAMLDAMAHEFKTPLTSMKAASGDLLSHMPLGGRDRELVEIIAEEVDRLQGLVSDAVKMVRIDSGDFVVRRERHHLAAIVRSTVRRLGPRLDGHPVINSVPDDFLVDADRDLLDLALSQLLDNAVKYSPPTSRIEITAADGDRARRGGRGGSNGESSEIAVRNSGPPIPEREQAHVFERFYRGAEARRVPGSGMGLAIVQHIAQAHGGEATVSCGPDGGVEFTLSLPRGGATR